MKCSTLRRHRQRALGRTHTSTIHTAIGTVSLAASSRCVQVKLVINIASCTSTAAVVHSGPILSLHDAQQSQGW